jgi:thymidylate synthase
MDSIYDIRKTIARKFNFGAFTPDKSGVKTIEIINAAFIATDDHIFGKPNINYIERELEWYKSQSLFVDDIPGTTPKIWKDVASTDGMINSNYGNLIWSESNYDQWNHCLDALEEDPTTRRAIMIYTRPTMQTEYKRDGMSDFICTNTVQYLIRDNNLHTIVSMRSNDCIFGYNNDYAWQKYVRDKLIESYEHDTGIKLHPGLIYWNVGSLHIYERHFYLLHHYLITNETHITKEEYDERYM